MPRVALECMNLRAWGLWSFAAYAFAAFAAVQREFSLSANPSNMKVDGGGRVFLAAGNQLLRLDSTLALQENVTLGSSVLRVALSSDERRVVVCLSDPVLCCVQRQWLWCWWAAREGQEPLSSSDVVALFTARENSFYVGSVAGGASESSMNLRQYGFGEESFARSTRLPHWTGWFHENVLRRLCEWYKYLLLYDRWQTKWCARVESVASLWHFNLFNRSLQFWSIVWTKNWLWWWFTSSERGDLWTVSVG